MKFIDIFYKFKTELFWFDGIIFVPLVRTEILHFSGIYLGGRTLGIPVYIIRGPLCESFYRFQFNSDSLCFYMHVYQRLWYLLYFVSYYNFKYAQSLMSAKQLAAISTKENTRHV